MKKVALNWKKLKKATQFGVGGLLALAGTVALTLLIFNVAYAGKVLPRIYLGKTSLVGLNEVRLREQATTAANMIKSKPITITIKDQTIEIKPDEIGVDVDITATVQEGLAIGRRDSIIKSLTEQFGLLITPKNINSNVSFDNDVLKKVLDERVKPFENPPINAELEFKDNNLDVKPSKSGLTIDRELALAKVSRALILLSPEKPIQLTVSETIPDVTTDVLARQLPIIKEKIGQPIVLIWQDKKFEYATKDMIGWVELDSKLAGKTITSANRETITKVVDAIAKKINRSAKDAKLKLQDQKVEIFEASVVGYQLEKEKTLEAIVAILVKNQADRTVELPVTEKQPSIATAQINDLGINGLIGKGTTSFAGSPENRKHNIGNGAKILNGVLIPPGSDFSTLAALGQIDDLAGFLPELVIKEDRTIPEFGGGLCQVSTTLFRAVLNAGLPITERRNHSWRISYYERGVGPGLDATVYSPAPDLKFKNDTPGWILIQGLVKGNEITFEFYGTKDGRRSVIEGPRLLSSTKAPAPVYLETSEIPTGETKQVEKPHPGGSTIATYLVYNSDGSERNRQVFRSSYKAVPARFLVGTGAAPAPEPESPPAQASAPSPAPEQPQPIQSTSHGEPSSPSTQQPMPSPASDQATESLTPPASVEQSTTPQPTPQPSVPTN